MACVYVGVDTIYKMGGQPFLIPINGYKQFGKWCTKKLNAMFGKSVCRYIIYGPPTSLSFITESHQIHPF